MESLLIVDNTFTNTNPQLTPDKYSKEKVLIELNDKDKDQQQNNNNQTQINIQLTIILAINTTNSQTQLRQGNLRQISSINYCEESSKDYNNLENIGETRNSRIQIYDKNKELFSSTKIKWSSNETHHSSSNPTNQHLYYQPLASRLAQYNGAAGIREFCTSFKLLISLLNSIQNFCSYNHCYNLNYLNCLSTLQILYILIYIYLLCNYYIHRSISITISLI